MNSKMLNLMAEETYEDELVKDIHNVSWPESEPDACHNCYATGKVTVCGLCEEEIPHTHCDDSWETDCKICKGIGKINIDEVPDSVVVYKEID